MQENETIHERITQLVKTFGKGKNTVFASVIGSNEANVRGYRTGIMPKFDFLEKIARNLDINLKWLLTGEGSMLNTSKSESLIKNDGNLIETPMDENFISVPIVDISVAAGSCGYDNPNYLEIIETIKLPTNMVHNNGTYFCVRVRGESMSPTLLDSSYVILRLLDRCEWCDLKDNYIYAISDREGRSYLKRIKNRLKEHGFIVCTSDNVDKANYPNFNLMENEINNILYAEWYLSAKMPNLNATYYDKVNHLEDDVDYLKGQMMQILKSINTIK